MMSVLRVLWMSTHGCFVSPFFPYRLMRPDDGAPEPAAPVDDHYYPTGGAYYYVETDGQE